MKRKMMKFVKNENTIAVKTYSLDNAKFRYNGKSSNFYFSKSEFDKLIIKSQNVIASDIYSFCKATYWRKNLETELVVFDFYWLDSNGIDIKGQKETVLIDYKVLNAWYYGNSEVLKVLDYQEKIETKIVFRDTDKLKNVIGNKTTRRKFAKKIMLLRDFTHDKVEVYSDWIDYSFGFSKFVSGEFNYNGGLIFHKDHKCPKDLTKGYFSIHT